MRRIIDYSGEKSFVSFITHAGSGGIVVAITEPGTATVKCLQATTVISTCESPPGWRGVVDLRHYSNVIVIVIISTNLFIYLFTHGNGTV